MRLWKRLWNDEAGVVMSSELVLLGTVGVLGAGVGLNMLTTSVNEEIQDVAYSIRSLDQSYGFHGYSAKGAWTAGSCYIQAPVKESLKELGTIEQRVAEAERDQRRKRPDLDEQRKKRKKGSRERNREESRKKDSKKSDTPKKSKDKD